MAVRQVMDNLADGPPIRAVRRVELRLGEIVDRVAHPSWGLLDIGDRDVTLLFGVLSGEVDLPDRKA